MPTHTQYVSYSHTHTEDISSTTQYPKINQAHSHTCFLYKEVRFCVRRRSSLSQRKGLLCMEFQARTHSIVWTYPEKVFFAFSPAIVLWFYLLQFALFAVAFAFKWEIRRTAARATAINVHFLIIRTHNNSRPLTRAISVWSCSLLSRAQTTRSRRRARIIHA